MRECKIENRCGTSRVAAIGGTFERRALRQHLTSRRPSAPGGPCNNRRKGRRCATATVLPHCGHLLSCGACQRCDALRVRRRIFEVLRFGTPIRADQESRKWEKTRGRFWMPGFAREGALESCLQAQDLLEFQLIQRAPVWRSLFDDAIRPGRDCPRGIANSAALAIAMRIGRQIEQNVFSHERREIDHLRPGQLGVNGKSRHLDLERKRLETADATQFDRLRQRSVCPKRAFGNPDVERIAQRPGAVGSLPPRARESDNLLRLPDAGLRPESGGDEFSSNLSVFLVRTLPPHCAGTNSLTSPPSRAISFTIRELR